MSASRMLPSPGPQPPKPGVEGKFVTVHGQPFYRIDNYDAMPPFFMSIVSSSDHYLFISSNGGLTAGRRNPDQALFPYYTDDRILDSNEHTGSKTILRVRLNETSILWEPFSVRGKSGETDFSATYSHNLYKSVYGNKIILEEVNHTLGLTFSYEWAVSDRFGFVRTARLVNQRPVSQSVEILDGLQNLMPCGVTKRFQLEYSTLVDGYKRTELERESGLAILQLTSVPVDRPEPSESLRANVAWSVGLERPLRLLSSVQLDRFRAGDALLEETDVHGNRGAYFVVAPLQLAAHGSHEWKIVADVNLDTADVHTLLRLLKHQQHLAEKVNEDVALGTASLQRIVASADGLQKTQDEASTWHHFASALFNVMRGGIPDDSYWIARDDFISFVRQINRQVAGKQKAFLSSLPTRLLHGELLRLVRAQQDRDFERIATEYLPLTFSRRHGDPSRPWNAFDIRLKDEHGHKILDYQGNWRDIFQNWEALSHSYPGFAISMVFKFLDSSTIDGYNPYRIARDGYDWEVLEPHDPWSFIGYWGDHQVIYLLRLLEQVHRYDPTALPQLLTHEVFTFANVPYRIMPYSDQLKDSRNTILFDSRAHRQILRNAAKLGADGKALADTRGQLVHATLAEKLLITLLVKLSNFVPEAGIWMNTQRPEWNDANNALVGAGTSMVTLYHLRRFVVFARRLFSGSGTPQVVLSAEVATFFESVMNTLRLHLPPDESPISDRARKTILDELGLAASAYREAIYDHGLSKQRQSISIPALTAFFDCTLQHIEHSIRVNRRADGLYHAYNLMEASADGIRVHNLPLMLEGQVAVLSSGALSPQETVSLLDALRDSSLYRPDQNSYVLYPVKIQRSFLQKNSLSPALVAKSKLLTQMIAQQDRRIVVSDEDGGIHFNGAFQNVSLLRLALAGITDRRLGKIARQEAGMICGLYEEVFQHRFFLGRSETFYKYEGIGCIYWHMVSKLLLAVREVLTEAVRDGAEETLLCRLREQYNSIRSGLGIHKTPAEYGAVPMDPYSHTPGFAGAQQPGMTGQVKEDLIARLGEMGVSVSSGEIHFVEKLMTSDEFLEAPGIFRYWDVDGKEQTLDLDIGMLVFQYCKVPVVLHRGGCRRVHITSADGSKQTIDGCTLDRTISKQIFDRTGVIRRVDVFLGTPQNKMEANGEYERSAP